MAGTGTYSAEEITRITTHRDDLADHLAWVSGTTQTFSLYNITTTATYDIGDYTLPSRTNWTGAGAPAFWAEWRTNNPSQADGPLYDGWDECINGANGLVNDGDGHHATQITSLQASLDTANTKLTLAIANAA